MSSERKKMSDFEWGSIGRYLVYIELEAGLTPVSDVDVYSFRIGKLGAKGLAARKHRTKEVLESNIKKLCRYVGKWEDSLTQNELDCLRSLYRTLYGSLRIVDGHIKTAEDIEGYEQLSATLYGEEEDDGLPY